MSFSPLNRLGLGILLGLQLMPEPKDWVQQLVLAVWALAGIVCLVAPSHAPAPPPPDPLKNLGVEIKPE